MFRSLRARPAVALAATLFAALACQRPHETLNAFVWSDSLGPGATLHLRDGNGDIGVRPSHGTSVTVTANKHWRHGRERDISFQMRNLGKDVYVCAMWRGSGECGEHGYRGARSTRGILTMFSLFRHNTDATADFTVEVPATTRIDASTTHGDIVIQGARAGVVARTVSGDVKAADAAGPVVLSTTNGDVELGLASVAGADSITLRTTNGDVKATVPGDLAGRLELSTVNGDLRSDFPLPPLHGHGRRTIQSTLGDSPRLIRLRTTNGDVTLVKAP